MSDSFPPPPLPPPSGNQPPAGAPFAPPGAPQDASPATGFPAAAPHMAPPPAGDLATAETPAPKFAGLPVYAWLGIIVVLIAGGIGLAFALGSDDKKEAITASSDSVETEVDETDPDSPNTAATAVPVTAADTVPEETTPEETLPTENTIPPGEGVVAGAPAGARGDRSSPVGVGQIADIGGGWRLQVLGVVGDATQAIITANDFNEPPPAGSQFTIVRVALGYFGVDDPQSLFLPTVSAIGAGSVELPTDCGIVFDALPLFSDVFAGGVVQGNLCFVTTTADVPALSLYGSGDFFGDNVFLNTAGADGSVPPMSGLRGAQAGAASTAGRTAPIAIGTPADVGSGWQLTINGPGSDITQQVLAANSFNSPPPAGYVFFGVPITLTYNGADSASPFEVTTGLVGAGNVSQTGSCGVVEGEPDLFSDVFAGGSVSGLACVAVPADEIGTFVVTARGDFDQPTRFFAVS